VIFFHSQDGTLNESFDMKTIKKSDQIADKIKDLKLGLVEATQIVVSPDDERFEQELQSLISELKQKFQDIPPSNDGVVSATRRMYRQVGWEPTKYRPSSEALIRRLIKGKGLYRINNLVDYGNLVSARFHIPMGLYDLDNVQGDICIDVGNEDESYEGISKPRISAGGKIILRDNDGVFGNPTADSKRTSITEKTNHILALFFVSSTIDDSHARHTIDSLAQYYSRFTTNKIDTEILNL
jgi:DNA/RNA-binding domain of Phe-tRNA-synthetase-like protein